MKDFRIGSREYLEEIAREMGIEIPATAKIYDGDPALECPRWDDTEPYQDEVN